MLFEGDYTSAFLWMLAFAAINTLGSVLFFRTVERRLAATRTLYAVPIHAGQIKRELLGSGMFVVAFAAVAASLLASGAIHFSSSASGAGNAAMTFLGCFLSFDIYYFFFHRSMHGQLRPIHEWHHASRVNTPWTALSLSPLETLGWLFGLCLWPVLASPFLPIVPEALVAWLLVFWWTNTMGHINVEVVPGFFSATRLGRALSHPMLYHALHHARFQRHYCFAFNSLDTLFGSVWPDYPSLHSKVLRGEPLDSLKERGADVLPAGTSI